MDTSPSELILLDGTVSSVIYRNEENGYTILRLEAPEAGEEVTVVGTMPGISPGEGLSVHGQWTRHSTYGEQFRAEIVERRMPVGEKALLEYLASGAVKGVGAAMARRLLDAFGEDVLTVIEEAPRRLTEVKGISPKRAETIHQSLCMQLSMRRLLDFLSAHGLSLSLAMPLYRRYGDLALTALRANPYLLTEEPLFTPFPAADKLARELGLEADDPLRLEAGLLYTLSHNLDNGHVFLPYAKLLTAAQRLLGTESSVLEDHLEGLTDRGTIVREEIAGQDACYLARLHYCETYVANALLEMEGEPLCPPEDLDALLDRIQREQGLTYAPLQVEAVKTAAQRQVMLLTGGPGTGKTTSLRGILSLFDHLQLAHRPHGPHRPGGQAAFRNLRRRGLHHPPAPGAPVRQPDGGTRLRPQRTGASGHRRRHFGRGLHGGPCPHAGPAGRPARRTAAWFWWGTPTSFPRWGRAICSRICSAPGRLPTLRLTEIFRQAAASRHHPRRTGGGPGETAPCWSTIPPGISSSSAGWTRPRRWRPSSTSARPGCPRTWGFPADQIQVLSPTRKGTAGTAALNRALQEAVESPRP